MNLSALFKQLSTKKPLLLKGVPTPKYRNPDKVHVIITKQTKRNNQIPLIPYEN
jgi:hypothetical protein